MSWDELLAPYMPLLNGEGASTEDEVAVLKQWLFQQHQENQRTGTGVFGLNATGLFDPRNVARFAHSPITNAPPLFWEVVRVLLTIHLTDYGIISHQLALQRAQQMGSVRAAAYFTMLIDSARPRPTLRLLNNTSLLARMYGPESSEHWL